MTIEPIEAFAVLVGKGKKLRCTGVTCHYCSTETKPVYARMVPGEVIYPNRPDLNHLNFWRCDCGAYTGTHEKGKHGNGTVPLGRLAHKSLRAAKQRAHRAFDPIWKTDKRLKRKQAYAWLAEQLGIDTDCCHIALFDEAACKRTEELALSFSYDQALAESKDQTSPLRPLTLEKAQFWYEYGEMVGITPVHLPPTPPDDPREHTHWISPKNQHPSRTFARRARAVRLRWGDCELQYHKAPPNERHRG